MARGMSAQEEEKYRLGDIIRWGNGQDCFAVNEIVWKEEEKIFTYKLAAVERKEDGWVVCGDNQRSGCFYPSATTCWRLVERGSARKEPRGSGLSVVDPLSSEAQRAQ